MRLSTLALLLFSVCATAQPQRTLSDDEWCRAERGGDRERACEVRETVLQARRLDVDATPNGGVQVKTWDRSDVLVRARVSSAAPTRAEAERLVAAARVLTDNGRVRAAVPEGGRNAWVTVSYEIFAPERTDLSLKTVNGGVSVEGVHGRIEADALNGGISLNGVGGDVRARTVNGGVSVALAGDTWEGGGLDVGTTNGGIDMTLPPRYSARLDAETRVGRISAEGLDVDRPDHRNERRMGGHVQTTLGQGGPPLRLSTTNGGVSIRRVR